LLVAGPFGKPRAEAELRGLFVLAGSDVEALVATDPAVHAGVLKPELVPFASATDLQAVHQRDLDFERRRKADPSIPEASGMRSYVALFAGDAARAGSALAPMREQRRIVLEGRFGGPREGQGLFVIAAANADEAHTLLEPLASSLGPHALVPWYGSASLASD
jgi:hypothetical protein